MPTLTLDELRQKRAEAQKRIYLRAGTFRGKITVHMDRCGIAAGSRGIMSALLQEMEQSGIYDIMVTTSGCAGLCAKEPMVTVEMADASPVQYGELTPDKARRVFREHICNGTVVTEYAIGTGSEKGG